MRSSGRAPKWMAMIRTWMRAAALGAALTMAMAPVTANAQSAKGKETQSPPAAPAATPPAAKAADTADTQSFSFIAFGDIPYRVPQDFLKLDRLIGAINAAAPAFAVHIGDIKAANEPCTDEYFRTVLARFKKVQPPLVYTPGDNEWTDCHRERAGRFNPRERLDKLRQIFFADPDKSLGANPMPLDSQSRVMPAHSRYVENVRFWRNGVLFLTVHVVGSNNGFETTELEAASEFFDRNRANVAWLDDSFKLARDQGAKAIVIAMQATLYDIKQRNPSVPAASGFLDTLRAIERGAKSFAKPLLVVQGDEHEFEVQGLVGTDYKRIPNAWRLQVMGDTYAHAVKVTVDPSSPGVFSYTPLIVPENGPQ